MRDESAKPLAKVSCLCGTTVKVDPLTQDRRVTCPGCNSTFDFVVTVDAARRKSMVSLVLPRSAMKPEGESLGMKGGGTEPHSQAPPAPAPEPRPLPKPAATRAASRMGRKSSAKTNSIPMAQCECGATFPLEDTGDLTSLQSCPQCNRVYHVVFKIEPGTKKKSAIIVPQKPIKHAMQTVAPSKPPPRPGDVTDFFTPGRKGRTRVPKGAARPKSPPEIPPGAQGVACSCGEIFVVRRRDLGQEKTCAACGKSAVFVEGCDPQSLAPIIRIRR